MDNLPPLRDVIARFGLSARKKLGQNFLLDMNLTRRIAREAQESINIKSDFSTGTVIEIGSGPGGLTRALLELGTKQLIAIEKDPRCYDALQEVIAVYPALEILKDDALKVDIASMGVEPRRIVANLPYNISTVLLVKWLRNIDAFESLTLMFQKEVADRLVSPSGNKTYGRLSIMTQWLCEVKPLFNVNPSAFTPPPKVTSTVVQIIPRKKPLAEADFDILEKVVAAAFGQRRKMLRSSLKSFGNATELCEKAGVNPQQRADNTTIEEFCSLARTVVPPM